MIDGTDLDPLTQTLRFGCGVAAGLAVYSLDRTLRPQIPRALEVFAASRRRQQPAE